MLGVARIVVARDPARERGEREEAKEAVLSAYFARRAVRAVGPARIEGYERHLDFPGGHHHSAS
jgi:hypothetical protein